MRIPIYIVLSWLVAFAGFLPANGQTLEEQVRAIVEQVSLDSLVHHVRALSGEDSVHLPPIFGDPHRDNEPFVITTRRARTTGHALAGYYLDVKLPSKYHEQFSSWTFPGDPYSGGTNRFLVHRSRDYSGGWPRNSVHEWQNKYILSAHYDSYSRWGRAPGADDNASGVAVVLEAARVLRSVATKYNVVFALFDVEEGGLLGSGVYAASAHRSTEEIRGVINLDMLGYDANNDRDFWIAGDTAHTEFSQTILSLNERYDIGLGKGEIAWAQGASDHSPFWYYGFPSVGITEGWWSDSDDVFEQYHTDADTIGHFNLDTYHLMAKLAVAAIAHFALGVDEVGVGIEGVGDIPSGVSLYQNYPNPFNPVTTIRFGLPEAAEISLVVYDILGREVARLADGTMAAGTHDVRFDAHGLLSGMFIYRLSTPAKTLVGRMMLVR